MSKFKVGDVIKYEQSLITSYRYDLVISVDSVSYLYRTIWDNQNADRLGSINGTDEIHTFYSSAFSEDE